MSRSSASQPRISCKAGISLESLSHVNVNESPLQVSSAIFQGQLAISIQDYLGPKGREGTPNPADGFKGREGHTWSIAVQGRFLDELTADDLMWGNTWSKPIRDSLPYGTSAGLAFVKIVDPALEFDLYADQPWALSPWLSTSQFVNALPHAPTEPLPAWTAPVHEDVTPLFGAGPEPNKKFAQDVSGLKEDPAKRKKWFAAETNRKAVKIDRSVVIASDFCNGYIDFKTLALKLPIGLSFPLVKYWDGQPVTFVLRDRSGSKTFLFVTLEIVPDEDGTAGGAEEEEEEQEQEQEEVVDADTLGVD